MARAPNSGYCQPLVPRVSPHCPLPLQDQRVDLNQDLFKLLLWPWVSRVYNILFAPFRVESLFPKTPWISQKYAMLAFKAKYSGAGGARFPGAGPPAWGIPCETQTSFCGERASAIIMIATVCGSAPRATCLVYTMCLVLFLAHTGSFFISLVVKITYSSFQVIFIHLLLFGR